jgi:hypothetical protein
MKNYNTDIKFVLYRLSFPVYGKHEYVKNTLQTENILNLYI